MNICNITNTVENVCTNKKICGSCTWSELPYEEQLIRKQTLINNALKKENLTIACTSILGSPKTSHYRNKMEYAINYQGAVGLREKGKWWKVIDGHTCFIADTSIENLFTQTRNWVKSAALTYYDRRSYEGLLRYAVIRATTTGETMVNIITSTPSDKKERQYLLQQLEIFQEKTAPTTLIWTINSTKADTATGETEVALSGNGYITEKISTFLYQIRPNSFFQTNSHCAKLLQEQVLTYVTEPQDTILDLYCGGGFFTLPLARKAKQVIGLENSEQAIIDANTNTKLNKIKNTDFLLDVSENIDLEKYKNAVVVLDPPRTGIKNNLLDQILRVKPAQLIYVSCNYQQFAIEAQKLTQIYNIKDLVAVDMFPQTPHVELVANLLLK